MNNLRYMRKIQKSQLPHVASSLRGLLRTLQANSYDLYASFSGISQELDSEAQTTRHALELATQHVHRLVDMLEAEPKHGVQ